MKNVREFSMKNEDWIGKKKRRFKNGNIRMRLTDPQPSTLERSFPVPSGRMATGGNGLIASSSMIDSTQPTVPSPPHARMRRSLKSPNILRLSEGGRGREGEEGGEGERKDRMVRTLLNLPY